MLDPEILGAARDTRNEVTDQLCALVEREPENAVDWFKLMRRRYRTDRVVWVYFVQCRGKGGPIKIGIARDVKKRMGHLRISNPYPLLCLVAVEAPYTTEHLLHARFMNHRIRGEWFRPHKSLLKFVSELQETI